MTRITKDAYKERHVRRTVLKYVKEATMKKVVTAWRTVLELKHIALKRENEIIHVMELRKQCTFYEALRNYVHLRT